MNAITFPRSAFIGFDRLFDELNSTHWSNIDNYPPHNIVKTGEDKFAIELAIAGFGEKDIDVTVKDGELFITGNTQGKNDAEDKEYLFKGISARKFKKTFKLQEYIEVTNAAISNGMLVVELEYKLPEEKKPKAIKINKGEPEYLKG